MTSTPKSLGGESLNGSWVDVTNETLPPAPTEPSILDGQIKTNLKEAIVKGLKSVERLLQDASREEGSGQSTALGSVVHSNSISPISPCSPLINNGGDSSPMSVFEAILLNQDDLIERSRRVSSEWLWDWSCRPGTSGDHQFEAVSKSGLLIGDKSDNHEMTTTSSLLHPSTQLHQQKKLSLRQWALRNGLFSKEILSIFFLSNVLSLLLGAGIGYSVLIKRSL